MKKVYTKPVMESEEFVSNEYVAACWTITCTNDSMFKESCGLIEGKDDLLSAYYTEVSDGSGMYTGEIDGKAGCLKVTKEIPFWLSIIAGLAGLVDPDIAAGIHASWNQWADAHPEQQYHPVEVTEGWDNHPNASV